MLILLGYEVTRVALVIGLGVTNPLELLLQPIEFFIREGFEIDEMRACSFYASEQLIKFQMNRLCIAVLRVLDQENHQERDYRRAGIDDQLPGVGIVK